MHGLPEAPRTQRSLLTNIRLPRDLLHEAGQTERLVQLALERLGVDAAQRRRQRRWRDSVVQGEVSLQRRRVAQYVLQRRRRQVQEGLQLKKALNMSVLAGQRQRNLASESLVNLGPQKSAFK